MESGVGTEKMIWRDAMAKKDSVLCVTVSDFYDAEGYIRDYDKFIKQLD